MASILPCMAVPMEQLIDLDAWVIRRAAALQQEVVTAYRDYQFHVIYQRVHKLLRQRSGRPVPGCAEGPHVHHSGRRACAPVGADRDVPHPAGHGALAGADPVVHPPKKSGKLLPGREQAAKSVFLSTWHQYPAVPESKVDWDALIALRQAVQRELEKLREAGTIGAPLEAEVDVYCLPEYASRYLAVGAELRFLTITSAVRVHKATSEPPGATAAETGVAVIPGVWLRAQSSAGNKCVRCWHLTDDVGSDATHPELCGRCAGNISGRGEIRKHV